MNSSSIHKEPLDKIPYHAKTPQHYIQQIEPQILSTFTPEQLEAIRTILNHAIPKNSPKIVDLRFDVDLIISRFYIILLVGKERRKVKRRYFTYGITKVGNLIAAILLLIGLNLMVSLFIGLFFYLVKSAVGIDLFHQEHLVDKIKNVLF